MYTNTCATIYRQTGGKYERLFLPAVFFEYSSTADTDKSGMTIKDKAQMLVPYSESEPIFLNVGKDLVLCGNISFEFDNTDEKTISEGLKQLRTLGEVMTVAAFSPLLYGSENVKHYEISLK